MNISWKMVWSVIAGLVLYSLVEPILSPLLGGIFSSGGN